MTELSYDGLLQAIEDDTLDPWRRLRVEPYDRGRLRSASLELHIGATLARWRHGPNMAASLGPRPLSEIDERDFDVTRGLGPGDRFVIRPGEAFLVAVDCWLQLGAQLVGKVEGKSTIARCSQQIHAAGRVEPGFIGILTLEPVNHAPVPVTYECGQPIAQLAIALLDQPTSKPYGHPEMLSRYQGQHEVTPPRRFALGSTWGSVSDVPGGPR